MAGRYCGLCKQFFEDVEDEGVSDSDCIRITGLCNECLEYHMQSLELEIQIPRN